MNNILNCLIIDFLDEEGLSADEEGLSDSSDDEFEQDAPGLPSSCYQDDDEDTAIIRPPPLLEEDRSDVPFEVQSIDEKEETIVQFIQDKCRCQLYNNSSCSDLFDITHFREMRNQCASSIVTVWILL